MIHIACCSNEKLAPMFGVVVTYPRELLALTAPQKTWLPTQSRT